LSKDGLSFDPVLPEQWESLSFKILFRGRTLNVNIDRSVVRIENVQGPDMDMMLSGQETRISQGSSVFAEH
jgi:trehalose/maltose hydrolase-like predicted phosphorylase